MLTAEDLHKLKNCDIVNKHILENKKFKGVSIDSRTCIKDDLFFAIKGPNFDGHAFINQVANKGLTAAVVDKKWYEQKRNTLPGKITYALVNDTTRTLGELARNHRRKFLIPVLAVAGSNGKTTTRDMIANLLSTKYNVLQTQQNLNNQYGVPLTIFRLRKHHDFCVIETGTNHFGEINYLCSIAEPQFGVVTNIAKEHLQFLKNINGAARAECELLDYIKNCFGTFFLNKDDSFISKSIGNFKHSFSYGSAKEADVKGKIQKFNTFYPVVSMSYRNIRFTATLSMIGSQSFASALCSAAVGFYFEVPPRIVKESLASFKVVTRRRNEMKKKNGVWIIDDTYNSNPESVEIALKNLKRYRISGNIHIVLSDMLELGKSSGAEHFKAGVKVRKMGFNNLYTYGSESYNTYKGAKGIKNNFYFTDKKNLIDLLNLTVKKNDLIFLKGSHSMKMEQVADSIIP